jgi:hypothetical protein
MRIKCKKQKYQGSSKEIRQEGPEEKQMSSKQNINNKHKY